MSDHDAPLVPSAHDAQGASGQDRARGRRPRLPRRPGLLVVAVAAFLAGATFSGAGAVWASHRFSDVPDTNQFHDDIDWMVRYDIAEGYDDGTFRPTAPVSRQAFAAFLRRYSQQAEMVTKDVDPIAGSTWSYVAICPAGMHVSGGGGEIDHASAYMAASTPYGLNAWYVVWRTPNGQQVDPPRAQVHALCLPHN